MRITDKQIFSLLVSIGVLFIPFTSLPIAPTDYRPVSVLFFMTAFFFRLSPFFEFKIGYLYCFKIGSLFFGSVVFVFYWAFNTVYFPFFIKAIVSIFLAFFVFYSVRHWFLFCNEQLVLFVLKLTLFFVILLGFFELLTIYGGVFRGVRDSFSLVVSGVATDRLQLTTSESSWAVKLTISLLPVALLLKYYSTNKRLYGYFFFSLLFLSVLTFSLEGFAVLLLTYSFYYFFTSTRRFFLFSLILVVVSYVTFIYLGEIVYASDAYYLARLRPLFEGGALKAVMSVDSSTFVRVMYPLSGFLNFIDNPFGVGLGQHGLYFHNHVGFFGVDYTIFNEVVDDLRNNSADPRNIYSRVFSETGFGGGLVFIFFMVFIFSRYFKLIKLGAIETGKLYLFTVLIMFFLMIQFGSFLYVNFWFLLAMTEFIYQKMLLKEQSCLGASHENRS